MFISQYKLHTPWAVFFSKSIEKACLLGWAPGADQEGVHAGEV